MSEEEVVPTMVDMQVRGSGLLDRVHPKITEYRDGPLVGHWMAAMMATAKGEPQLPLALLEALKEAGFDHYEVTKVPEQMNYAKLRQRVDAAFRKGSTYTCEVHFRRLWMGSVEREPVDPFKPEASPVLARDITFTERETCVFHGTVTSSMPVVFYLSYEGCSKKRSQMLVLPHGMCAHE